MLYLSPIVANLVGQSPLILVWLVGGAIAIARWNQHPRVSRLAIIAFGGFLVPAIINALVTGLLPVLLIQSGAEPQAVGGILAATTIFLSVLFALLWIPLLLALFGQRSEQ